MALKDHNMFVFLYSEVTQMVIHV